MRLNKICYFNQPQKVLENQSEIYVTPIRKLIKTSYNKNCNSYPVYLIRST